MADEQPEEVLKRTATVLISPIDAVKWPLIPGVRGDPNFGVPDPL